MKITKLHHNIGVSIEGINLNKLDKITFEKIQELWMENLIIVFPNQDISDEEHIIFG